MKKVLLLLLILIINESKGQVWKVLASSPSSASFRHDDLFFINQDTGWVCNVDGKIYKTLNGGNSWTTQLNQPNTSFRCIGFANSLNGWAGNLGTGSWSPTIDTLPLYSTNDGGSTWQPVLNITGTLPQGICGINVVNDSVIYAVGRVGGPAFLLKTINGGISWQSIDMNLLALQLIDCKFFSVDTGIVVGGFPGPTSNDSKYRILYTTDGGINWQIVASGVNLSQNCWKTYFVNRTIGYVSVESDLNNDTLPVLKTTDGGLTWQEKIFSIHPTTYEQGIGFINDTIGWSGAFGNDIKMTTNGGDTWTNQPSILPNFNRLRKVNDTLAYAVGNRVWKYSMSAVGISEQETLKGFLIKSVSPNPFSEHTNIIYTIPYSGLVEIRTFDFAGRPINALSSSFESSGEHSFVFNAPYYFDTHFFIVIKFGNYQIAKKIICVK